MTLVELMIAMALSSFAIAAIVMAFRSQDASSLLQETMTDMQQNNSSAIYIMAKELRMAGYDPTENGTSPPTAGYDLTALLPGVIPANTIAMLTATDTTIRFTADLNGDGDVDDPSGTADEDPNEDITFGFRTVDDADGNGIADAGVAELRRGTGGGMAAMAENIEAVNFAYAYDANGDGDLETTAGNTIWAFNSGGTWFNLDSNADGTIDAQDDTDGDGVNIGVTTGDAFDINDIRAVKVWVLARSDRADTRYTNSNTYVVGRQVITPGDRFYRRLLSTTVTCRNLGM